jgi:cytochrome P450
MPLVAAHSAKGLPCSVSIRIRRPWMPIRSRTTRSCATSIRFWSKEPIWIHSRHADISPRCRTGGHLFARQSHGRAAQPRRNIGTTDPPRHDRLRALIQHAFTRRGLEAIADPVRVLVRESLDELKGESV